MGLRQKIQNVTLGIAVGAAAIMLPLQVFAEEAAHGEEASGGHGAFAIVFLMLAIVLFAGKVGNLVERFKQPAVIGELLAGVFLSLLAFFGLDLMSDIRHNEIIGFISELGVMLLLFQIGLESNIQEMIKVGPRSLAVAMIGAVIPFVLGTFIVGPIFFPESEFIAHLFLGASLVATSVGIPSSVFKGLGKTKMPEFKTFLGATVIDDVIGLIVLAVVSALASGGDVTALTVAILAAKAFGFLAAAMIIGTLMTKHISRLFSSISSGIGMKITLALVFALVLGFLASLVGLAAIVGAFAAGLLLDPVHFDSFEAPAVASEIEKAMSDGKINSSELSRIVKKSKHAHVEDLIGNLGLVFIPVFFVYTGLQIEIESLLDPSLYVSAGIISLLAIASKVVAGLAAGKTMNGNLLIGFSMVPRGEVGLIFAASGLALGAIKPETFSIIVIVVMVTTFIAPPFVKKYIVRVEAEKREAKS